MKNLKELEQKYLELGKEIEALKKQSEEEEFKYPIYCKLKDSSLVVKFKGSKNGKTVVNNTFNNVGEKSFTWQNHSETITWQQLDVCEKTGFFDGQLVWCWDIEDSHTRILAFYDAKNECIYQFNGNRNGIFFHNYEPFEGNYPDWALEAFQTLKR
jgi:hypothetical protein